MLIQPAEAGHLPQVKALFAGVYRRHSFFREGDALFARGRTDGSYVSYVGIDRGAVIAHAAIRGRGAVAVLCHLVVRADHRTRGIAGLLTDARVARILAAQRFEWMAASCVVQGAFSERHYRERGLLRVGFRVLWRPLYADAIDGDGLGAEVVLARRLPPGAAPRGGASREPLTVCAPRELASRVEQCLAPQGFSVRAVGGAGDTAGAGAAAGREVLVDLGSPGALVPPAESHAFVGFDPTLDGRLTVARFVSKAALARVNATLGVA